MKVLHTIAGFGIKSGGTSTCTYNLISNIHDRIEHIDLLTPQVIDTTDRLIGKSESWIKALPYDYVSPYGFSSNLKKFLQQNDYDIYHTNGLWMHINHTTCCIARKKAKPYVITPHGMLYPQALERSAWKKRLLLKLGFRKNIAKATCIHVTCQKELEHVRKFGYKGPIAIIPNPIKTANEEKERKKSDIMRIGYLGRIHPIKNIENLLYAWRQLNLKEEEAQLVIIGDCSPNEIGYEKFLKKEQERLAIKNILWTGFLSGIEKEEMLSSLSLLVVPSKSENFGMIIPEALLNGIPVIASKGTPWEELNIYNCGWWVDNDVETLTQSIQKAISLPEEIRIQMGVNGQKMVKENYSVEVISQKMCELYDWILNEGNKPEFVYDKY